MTTRQQLIIEIAWSKVVCKNLESLWQHLHVILPESDTVESKKFIDETLQKLDNYSSAVKASDDDPSKTEFMHAEIMPIIEKILEVMSKIITLAFKIKDKPDATLITQQVAQYMQNIKIYFDSIPSLINSSCDTSKTIAIDSIAEQHFATVMQNINREILIQCLCSAEPKLTAWYMRTRLREMIATTYRQLQLISEANKSNPAFPKYVALCKDLLYRFKHGEIKDLQEESKKFSILIDQIAAEINGLSSEFHNYTKSLIIYANIFIQHIANLTPVYANVVFCRQHEKRDAEQLIPELQNVLYSVRNMCKTLLFVKLYYERLPIEQLSEQQLGCDTLADLPQEGCDRFIQANSYTPGGRYFWQCLSSEWQKNGFYCLGDVHADLPSLLTGVTKILARDPAAKFVFLGDYIDRGHYNLETILFLALLLRSCPEHVILLRGNHEQQTLEEIQRLNPEDSNTRIAFWNQQFGLMDLYKQVVSQTAAALIVTEETAEYLVNLPISADSWLPHEDDRKYLINSLFKQNEYVRTKYFEAIINIFNSLPTVALIGGNILAAHGGFFLTRPSKKELLDNSQEIVLWSGRKDTAEGELSKRGAGLNFGLKTIEHLGTLGIDTLLLGHEHKTIKTIDGKLMMAIINSTTLTAETAYVAFISPPSNPANRENEPQPTNASSFFRSKIHATDRIELIEISHPQQPKYIPIFDLTSPANEFEKYFCTLGITASLTLIANCLCVYWTKISADIINSAIQGEFEHTYVHNISSIIIAYLNIWPTHDTSNIQWTIDAVMNSMRAPILSTIRQKLPHIIDAASATEMWCQQNSQQIYVTIDGTVNPQPVPSPMAQSAGSSMSSP